LSFLFCALNSKEDLNHVFIHYSSFNIYADGEKTENYESKLKKGNKHYNQLNSNFREAFDSIKTKVKGMFDVHQQSKKK